MNPKQNSKEKSWILGQSRLGIPIPAWDFGSEGPRVLLLAGVHGDECEGVATAHGLLAHFLKSFDYRLRLTLIPMLNMDGVLLKTRWNGAAVDLNRNLPTRDWTAEAKTPRYNPGPEAGSEPENQALIRLLDSMMPDFIYSLHSWNPVINTNGDCGEEAKLIAKMTGYRISDDIGYPTPGSLGTYAGKERKIPTLTYEIQEDLPLDQVLKLHVPPLLEALKISEKRTAKN